MMTVGVSRCLALCDSYWPGPALSPGLPRVKDKHLFQAVVNKSDYI